MSIMKRIFFLFLIFGAISAVILSKSLKGSSKRAPINKELRSKAAIPQTGPPKVKPYVADVIPENTFKIPKMMLSLPEVYRRDQDLGILKLILKLQMCDIEMEPLLMETELDLCKL
jgi:hypothetical protein